MSLDKDEKKTVLEYVDGFTEKNETMIFIKWNCY